MNLSEKQTLLQYFKAKDSRELTIVCKITGMHFTILAPNLPNIEGLVYSGLSPLADLRAAETFACYSYSKGHYDQEHQTLAGCLLSLFHHYKLRKDKLSAVEANMILSKLPLYTLSQALNYVVNLSEWDRKRIDGLSLAEGDPMTLKAWLHKAYEILDISNYAPLTEEEQPKPKTKALLVHSVSSETKQQAKSLLAHLKANTDIDSKLSSVISMSIAKNNLAMIGKELRASIIKGLDKLDTPESLELAEIFTSAASNASHQEAIVSKLLDEPVSQFSAPIPLITSRMSLKEIIAMKKEQEARQAQRSASQFIDLLKGAEQELIEDKDKINSEDALAHTVEDDLEVEMDEAGIEELDFDKDR